jgi:hypothetical protein
MPGRLITAVTRDQGKENEFQSRKVTENRRKMPVTIVPSIATNVEFTSVAAKRTLQLSSSGGGLFGRLMTRKSSWGAF